MSKITLIASLLLASLASCDPPPAAETSSPERESFPMDPDRLPRPAPERIERPPAGDDERQPNIVLILMDNFGYGELGVYGGGVLRGAPTPRIDALAAEGMRLTNFNVEAQCTPSRAALLTGRYAVRTGNGSVPLSTPRYGLTQWEVTLAESLSEAGYATGMFGKWHLGHTEGRFPTDQGFDEWYGIPNSSDESLWPQNPSYRPDSNPFAHPEQIMESTRGAEPTELHVYDGEQRTLIDHEITERTMRFMEAQAGAGKPFFAYVPYTMTHLPLTPHPDFAGSTRNGNMADCLAQIDAYVGRLLDKVDELGVAEDTIFIFTSDNGPEALVPYHGTSGPWRGTYFTALEGSLRVPFIVRWPGRVPAGATSDEIMHQMDVFPTLARIAGARVPTDRLVDGVDQTDFLLGDSERSFRESFVVYVGNDIYGVKWRNWKMMTKRVDTGFGEPVQTYGMPLIYDLYTDPKEEIGYGDPRTAASLWVRWPAGEVLTQHMASFQREPAVPPGAADPYVPGR